MSSWRPNQQSKPVCIQHLYPRILFLAKKKHIKSNCSDFAPFSCEALQEWKRLGRLFRVCVWHCSLVTVRPSLRFGQGLPRNLHSTLPSHGKSCTQRDLQVSFIKIVCFALSESPSFPNFHQKNPVSAGYFEHSFCPTWVLSANLWFLPSTNAKCIHLVWQRKSGVPTSHNRPEQSSKFK